MSLKLRDAKPASLSGTRKTAAEGYLIADAYVARPGVQLYLGKEVGFDDMETVRVYRPESEVRSPESLRSFSHAPVTMGHPAEDVTAANWKDHAKGEVSTEVEWRDNKIKIPLVLKDQAAIEAVESGTRELSPGYTAEIVRESGISAQGEPYDAIQQNIRINHLAIVPRGRSGPEVRIGDAAPGQSWGVAPITDAAQETPMNLRKMLVDGLSVETTDAGAQAIEKLQKQLADSQSAHADAIAAKDRELAAQAAELDKAKASRISDEDFAAKVASRADLISRAALLVKDALPGSLSDEEIRRKAVAAKLGDAAVAGKSDAYVEVRFDDLHAEAIKAAGKSDPVLSAVRDAAPSAPSAAGTWDHVLKAQGFTN